MSEHCKLSGKTLKILDMGSGSGIQAQTCLDWGFENVLCADIDKEVVGHLREKKLEVVESDLFSNIKSAKKFDLIILSHSLKFLLSRCQGITSLTPICIK